jgi:hypothetical protein
MQYTLSLTSRMMTLLVVCFALLAVLLFLTGMEIGKRFALPSSAAAPAPVAPSTAASQPAASLPPKQP